MSRMSNELRNPVSCTEQLRVDCFTLRHLYFGRKHAWPFPCFGMRPRLLWSLHWVRIIYHNVCNWISNRTSLLSKFEQINNSKSVIFLEAQMLKTIKCAPVFVFHSILKDRLPTCKFYFITDSLLEKIIQKVGRNEFNFD